MFKISDIYPSAMHTGVRRNLQQKTEKTTLTATRNQNKKTKEEKNLTDGDRMLITVKLDSFHRNLSSYNYRIDTSNFLSRKSFVVLFFKLIFSLFILDFQL